MSLFARIVSERVSEIIDLDPALHAAWVAAGNPKANAYLPLIETPQPAYDPATQALVRTYDVGLTSVTLIWSIRPLTPDELRKVWTSYEFLERFTSQERRLIWSRAKSNDDVADFLMLCQAAQEIVSDDPNTIAGMNLLVSLNIISAARRAQILG